MDISSTSNQIRLSESLILLDPSQPNLGQFGYELGKAGDTTEHIETMGENTDAEGASAESMNASSNQQEPLIDQSIPSDRNAAMLAPSIISDLPENQLLV